MKSIETKTLLLVLIIGFLSPSDAWRPVIPKTYVEVYNRLPGGADFTIHCKSKNDDLGVHIVHGAGGLYRFEFRVNWVVTTLFFCRVQWQGKSLVNDFFRARRDNNRCGDLCKWEVRVDGVFGYEKDGKVADIVYKWG